MKLFQSLCVHVPVAYVALLLCFPHVPDSKFSPEDCLLQGRVFVVLQIWFEQIQEFSAIK
jgi:hypothetical protein